MSSLIPTVAGTSSSSASSSLFPSFPGPTPSSLLSISVSSAKYLLEDHLWPSPLYYGSRTLLRLRAAWPYAWRIALMCCIVHLSYRLYRRRQFYARQHTVERSYALFGRSVRFGLDIGGTLCKVVYYEPAASDDVASNGREKATDAQTALRNRVSSFILRSNSYGVTGHRDEHLEELVQPIGGTLHFLKFQTSMMANFVNIVREEGLSPQRPLKDGGGTDEPDANHDSIASGLRCSTNAHHNHHARHLHQPAMIGRSHSAAWRSEADERIQYQNGMHRYPTLPSAITSSSAITHDELKIDCNADDAVAASATIAIIDVNPSSSAPQLSSIPASSAADATSLSHAHTSSSSSTASTNSPTFTPRECSSASCPSSPLCGNRKVTFDDSNQNDQTATPSSTTTDASSSPPAPTASAVSPSLLRAHRARFASDSGLSSRSSSSSSSGLASSSPSSSPIPPSVCATGGGAFKFESLFRDQLHVTLHKCDELRALVRGIDFMIHTVRDECYYLSQFRFREPLQTQAYPSRQISYPYLVVNIGSGVSILKVSGPSTFSRVGGTSLGGGTFYGLCRALTGCGSFEEALAMAERGRSATADLLVGDIYGGNYDEIGLPADTVAASFGKLVRGDALKDVRKEDLAKAALVMITNNIGSLANLYARKVLHVPQMIFVGNFLNNNDIARRGLAFATDYWSQGKAKALFLTHEGYFGAVGSLLGEA